MSVRRHSSQWCSSTASRRPRRTTWGSLGANADRRRRVSPVLAVNTTQGNQSSSPSFLRKYTTIRPSGLTAHRVTGSFTQGCPASVAVPSEESTTGPRMLSTSSVLIGSSGGRRSGYRWGVGGKGRTLRPVFLASVRTGMSNRWRSAAVTAWAAGLTAGMVGAVGPDSMGNHQLGMSVSGLLKPRASMRALAASSRRCCSGRTPLPATSTRIPSSGKLAACQNTSPTLTTIESPVSPSRWMAVVMRSAISRSLFIVVLSEHVQTGGEGCLAEPVLQIEGLPAGVVAGQ